MTEFFYIQNKNWNGCEEWKPFHIKNNEEYSLFDNETKFYLMDLSYKNRFDSLIFNKILTYD